MLMASEKIDKNIGGRLALLTSIYVIFSTRMDQYMDVSHLFGIVVSVNLLNCYHQT